MLIALLAFLIGVIAGLRAMTAPAVTSWAARLGWISVASTPFSFMAKAPTPWIFALLALGELANDKRPTTPSRKIPMQFGARIVSGGFAGAVLGATHGALVFGLVAGAAGAVAGTLGGSAARGALAKMFGKDLPAALIEDAVAVFGGLAIVSLA
ncbi:MAG: hypothetical protein K0S65_4801 [Labilithrix sp.]|nr:hypothetical protein [Labilithrix sp.]